MVPSGPVKPPPLPLPQQLARTPQRQRKPQAPGMWEPQPQPQRQPARTPPLLQKP
jgi:hypothetical protein